MDTERQIRTRAMEREGGEKKEDSRYSYSSGCSLHMHRSFSTMSCRRIFLAGCKLALAWGNMKRRQLKCLRAFDKASERTGEQEVTESHLEAHEYEKQ